MSNLIRFEFSSEEERNEFLILNDLRLDSTRPVPQQTIVDQSGNRVGLTDGARCGLDIEAAYRPCIRSARWWYASTSFNGDGLDGLQTPTAEACDR